MASPTVGALMEEEGGGLHGGECGWGGGWVGGCDGGLYTHGWVGIIMHK